jgi:hypothetical protein
LLFLDGKDSRLGFLEACREISYELTDEECGWKFGRPVIVYISLLSST